MQSDEGNAAFQVWKTSWGDRELLPGRSQGRPGSVLLLALGPWSPMTGSPRDSPESLRRHTELPPVWLRDAEGGSTHCLIGKVSVWDTVEVKKWATRALTSGRPSSPAQWDGARPLSPFPAWTPPMECSKQNPYMALVHQTAH